MTTAFHIAAFIVLLPLAVAIGLVLIWLAILGIASIVALIAHRKRKV